jgi:hypothetical protein
MRQAYFRWLRGLWPTSREKTLAGEQPDPVRKPETDFCAHVGVGAGPESE